MFFTIHTGAPLAVIRNGKPRLSPPQLGDMLCKVEWDGGGDGDKGVFFKPVAEVVGINPITPKPASSIDGSFIPNGAVTTDSTITVDETKRPVDTTKVTVSLLTPLPLTLAVFSDEKWGYVNIVLTED